MRKVELWTDGSGTVVGEPGGWCFILRTQKSDGSWVERVEVGPATATSNNRMEIMGLIMGLRTLQRPCVVLHYSDSEYVVNAIRKKWIGKWKAKDWHKVKNDDLWREVCKLLNVHDVRSDWVRGHSGVELNERCDKLAGEQRAFALSVPEFLPEPAGDNMAVQPSMFNSEDAHLDSIAAGA